MASVMDCVKGRDLPKLLGALAQGGQVDARDQEGWTALGRASADGFAEGVGALLDAGADLEAADGEGEPALAWAARLGRLSCVQLLLARGAKVDSRDFFGNTPAMHAVGASAEGFEMTLKCLFDAGADLDALNENGESVALIAAKGSLIEGVQPGIVECVELMVAAGVDFERELPSGETALGWARTHRRLAFVELIESLALQRSLKLELGSGSSKSERPRI